MNIPIIIQARINSSRLPRKVLALVNGKPLLNYLFNNLLKSFNREKIILATSNKSHDKPIIKFCKEQNINCFIGSLSDVAKRMLSVAKYYNTDAFVRINGDSPFIDSKIIIRALSIFNDGNYDLVTNTFPRSFPIGQSVEVIDTKKFEKTYKKMTKPEEFEHITKYYYNNKDQFKIKNFQNEQDLSSYRLVIDTKEDLNRMKKMVKNMKSPFCDYNFNDLIELYNI